MKKKKIIFHQDNAPCHNSMKTMVKLGEFGFCVFPPPIVLHQRLFADLKKMLQGKKLGSNKQAIAAMEAYFEVKDKSLYKHGIKKLEKHGK